MTERASLEIPTGAPAETGRGLTAVAERWTWAGRPAGSVNVLDVGDRRGAGKGTGSRAAVATPPLSCSRSPLPRTGTGTLPVRRTVSKCLSCISPGQLTVDLVPWQQGKELWDVLVHGVVAGRPTARRGARVRYLHLSTNLTTSCRSPFTCSRETSSRSHCLPSRRGVFHRCVLRSVPVGRRSCTYASWWPTGRGLAAC